MTQRRNFLIGCGSALAASGLHPASIAAMSDTSAAAADMRGGFSKARFEALINQEFRISQGRRGAVGAKLVEVRHAATQPDREEFTVVFQSDSAANIEAGIYDVRQGNAGRFQLYLEPATRPGSRGAFTASFNLLS